MNTTFTAVAENIKNRRTVKPGTMNGNKVPNGEIAALLELANWAPTHALTEPWRFVVYERPLEFNAVHAQLYKQNTAEENFNEAQYSGLSQTGAKASHAIIVYMHREETTKIPVFEEIAATACAIQNIMLGAAALNIGTFWSTGGMTLKPAMKEYLQLGDLDQVMGVLYLGYTDVQPEGRRKVPLDEKISWK
ncbi:nitroreductase family protein [Mucilaginibacter ginkgonis]|uniref:Putative NAD(P)H nitroreductase n=1 Tax=Mucilaginibacter ginkgonis TaxID=2682091 RepID=A0A6I4I123_9SPHI|nr:nitroreductase [Mucilaginibacter ginkgonis]QQL50490.1 nitroreductase [Mucilaginibacter ginkgonis]